MMVSYVHTPKRVLSAWDRRFGLCSLFCSFADPSQGALRPLGPVTWAPWPGVPPVSSLGCVSLEAAPQARVLPGLSLGLPGCCARGGSGGMADTRECAPASHHEWSPSCVYDPIRSLPYLPRVPSTQRLVPSHAKEVLPRFCSGGCRAVLSHSHRCRHSSCDLTSLGRGFVAGGWDRGRRIGNLRATRVMSNISRERNMEPWK